MKNERRSQIKAYISEHKSARIEDLAKQNPDVSPVSYTHLDVYKRQMLTW